MLRSRAHAPFILIAVLSLALPTQAAPAPIVFDFEDGLQGWELRSAAYQSPSSAQRVQTQVLGGEWAIFGDGVLGGASMSIEVDLTDIASITVEHFYISGNESGLGAILFRSGPNGGHKVTFQQFEVVESGNPSLRTIRSATSTGMDLVEIRWGLAIPDLTQPFVVAFIDNITFHPVPEPGTLVLVALSLATLVIARRRIVQTPVLEA